MSKKNQYVVVRKHLHDSTKHLVIIVLGGQVYDNCNVTHHNKKNALKDARTLNNLYGDNYKYAVLRVEEVTK